MRDRLILVDENDNDTGTAGKMEAHEQGLLHRAFSVVLFQKENPELFLMQRRAAGKYHCPLLWANTCCSHPYPGETAETGAYRRVFEELGLKLEDGALMHGGTYRYRAPCGELVENEITHVFVGYLSKDVPVPFSAAEVAAVEWAASGAGKDCAPWLEGVLEKARAAVTPSAVQHHHGAAV